MNNKLKEFYRIKENFDKQVSEEIKKTGLFFAFSKEQFEENKTYKDIENMKYYFICLVVMNIKNWCLLYLNQM